MNDEWERMLGRVVARAARASAERERLRIERDEARALAYRCAAKKEATDEAEYGTRYSGGELSELLPISDSVRLPMLGYAAIGGAAGGDA